MKQRTRRIAETGILADISKMAGAANRTPFLVSKFTFIGILTAFIAINFLLFFPKADAKPSLSAAMPPQLPIAPIPILQPVVQQSKNNVFDLTNAHAVNILIETGMDYFSLQQGYTFDQFGAMCFTNSAITVGLPSLLSKIKHSCDVGRQLISSIEKKGCAVVWEAARLRMDGDLVLAEDIFGYMDKDLNHSGLMRLNLNALQYIIIDVSPVKQETIHGHQLADIETVMAHEAIHAVLPNQYVITEYEQGRALNELFTVYYTNQIRFKCHRSLRISYGDPLTKPFDDVVREGLKTGRITEFDLIGDLHYRLNGLGVNPLHEPNSLDKYGLSQNLLSLFEENGLLKKNN